MSSLPPIRQSLLGNVDDCLLKAQFSLDWDPSWPRIGSAPRTLGTGFHAAAEWLYGVRKETDPAFVPSISEFMEMGVSAFDEDFKSNDEFKWTDKLPDRTHCINALELLSLCFLKDGLWPADYNVVDTELKFSIQDKVILQNGTIDLVLEKDGWIICVDYKTAGKAWGPAKWDARRNNQGPFYVRAMRTLFPDAAGYRMVFDVLSGYAQKGGVQFNRLVCDPTPAHEAAVIKKAEDFAVLYQTIHVEMGRDLPGNSSSILCAEAYCDHWARCVYGGMPMAA